MGIDHLDDWFGEAWLSGPPAGVDRRARRGGAYTGGWFHWPEFGWPPFAAPGFCFGFAPALRPLRLVGEGPPPLEELDLPNVVPTASLVELGWDDGWARALAESPDPLLRPGRVSRIDRGAFTVFTADGPKRVGADRDQIVAVGDWVTLADDLAASGQCRLAGVLPRRCTFRRVKEASSVEQVVAANIDTVLLTDAVDGFLTTRHLERYLALAWQSGVTPVVVITKADLKAPEQVRDHLASVRAVALDVAVHLISAVTGEGIDELAPYIAPGKTVTLLGLSGAGKSTLVNLLAGEELLNTGLVSADGHGRHTTTHRQLVVLPGGGVLIDTPGMRALSVRAAGEGVARAFDDIENLSGLCEFPDCSHHSEPGCAILAAVDSGDVTVERVESWRRLRGETGSDHHLARLQVEDRKRRKAVAKAERAESRHLAKSLVPPSPHAGPG